MKITLESTTRIVEINGVPARLWEGETASGIKVQALITRIAAPADADQAQFKAELAEQRAPEQPQAFPLRMVI